MRERNGCSNPATRRPRSLRIERQAETDRGMTILRPMTVPVRGAAPGGRIGPGTAAADTPLARLGTGRILGGACAVAIGLPTVAAPFPDVAVHIQQAPGVRLEF